MQQARDTIIMDIGSSHGKGTRIASDIHPEDVARVSFKSVVADLGLDVPDIPHQYDPMDGDGFVFNYGGRWWAVGSVAERHDDPIEVRGGRRYNSKEWEVLIAAMLCALVPETEGVNLMIAKPLGGSEAAEQVMLDRLAQSYKVRLYHPSIKGNAGSRTIGVFTVSTMHETEGAYFFYLLDEFGEPRPSTYFASLNRDCSNGVNDLFDYGLILWDGGGWTADTLPVTGLHPDFDNADTERGTYGLNNILRWFEDELQSHPVVGGGSAWQTRILEDALIPKGSRSNQFKIRFGRKQEDVRQQVEKAVERVAQALAQHIVDALEGGRDNNYLFLTGGAAGAVHPWIAEAIKDMAERRGMRNHIVVMRPDFNTPTYYHNVEGMARYLRRKWSRVAQTG